MTTLNQKNEAREWEESEDRKISWQKFVRERLGIEPGQEKYIASGFSLREMWSAHAHGFSFQHKSLQDALEMWTQRNARLQEKLARANKLIRKFDPDDCFCFEDGSEDLAQEVVEYLNSIEASE